MLKIKHDFLCRKCGEANDVTDVWDEGFDKGMEAERKSLMKKIENLYDPYPKDIFKPLQATTLARAVKALQDAGISPDGYSAELMRRSRFITTKDILQTIKETD